MKNIQNMLKTWPRLTTVPYTRYMRQNTFLNMIYTGSSWLFRMGSNYAEVTKRTYQSPSHPCSKYIFWILAIPFSYIGKIIKRNRKCDETMMKHYPNAPYLWITYLHYVKETWPHSGGNVGKYSFHGASGLSLPWIISETISLHRSWGHRLLRPRHVSLLRWQTLLWTAWAWSTSKEVEKIKVHWIERWEKQKWKGM